MEIAKADFPPSPQPLPVFLFYPTITDCESRTSQWCLNSHCEARNCTVKAAEHQCANRWFPEREGKGPVCQCSSSGGSEAANRAGLGLWFTVGTGQLHSESLAVLVPFGLAHLGFPSRAPGRGDCAHSFHPDSLTTCPEPFLGTKNPFQPQTKCGIPTASPGKNLCCIRWSRAFVGLTEGLWGWKNKILQWLIL